MAHNTASFDFVTFKVHVKYVGQQGGYAYVTRIEIPGYDPIDSGVFLLKYKVFSSAAAGAIDQLRGILQQGVPAFLEDWRKQKGTISFKEVQNMRLTFLSWKDAAISVGGEPALAAAVEQLEGQELAERKAAYGGKRRPIPGEIPVDVQYDLGSVVMDMRVMGLIEGFPLWYITAKVPGTNLYANTVIGAESPFSLPFAQLMVDNLEAVLRQGVEGYLRDDPRATRTPVTPDKRSSTEALYAVASHIGPEGIALADQNVKALIQEKLDTLEGEALEAMEATIAEYRSRKPKTS
jgi:hypothetical protein